MDIHTVRVPHDVDVVNVRWKPAKWGEHPAFFLVHVDSYGHMLYPFLRPIQYIEALWKKVIFFIIYHGIQSVGTLKALYTLPPGRPIHSGTNSTSLGRILARQQLCAKTIHSNISTTVYSRILTHTVERTEAQRRKQNYPNSKTAEWDSNPGRLNL